MSQLCDFCGKNEIDGRYQEVTGLEKFRREGGANQILARRPTGRRPCRECVVKLVNGIPIEQESLL